MSENILLLQSDFDDIIKDLQNVSVKIPPITSPAQIDLQSGYNGELTTAIEEIRPYCLNPREGLYDDRKVFAYDESIMKFSCLEGTAYLTAHSLVYMGEFDYIPTGFLTFYFYTKSKEIVDKSKCLKLSSDPEMDSKKDYIKDRIWFLANHTPPNSILLIDGPLIGGDVYTYMINALQRFTEKNIIPIFFVKNSASNLVTDSMDDFKGKYNSDMHWSYCFLKKGERTNFFRYTDRINPNNAKVFCYLKSYDCSPQRVEFSIDTYNIYKSEIEKVLDMVHYLLLAQGDRHNPQVRPIAIAEKYAREYIKLTDLNKYFFNLGLVPTMNQERFGRDQ